MIFNMINCGGSSGSGIDYMIICNTTRPNTQTAKTIWVNSNVAMNSHQIRYYEPMTPTEGMIWIKSGLTSPVAFNALKQDTIIVCPIACYQYISNKWVKKEAQIYTSTNGWVTFSELSTSMLLSDTLTNIDFVNCTHSYEIKNNVLTMSASVLIAEDGTQQSQYINNLIYDKVKLSGNHTVSVTVDSVNASFGVGNNISNFYLVVMNSLPEINSQYNCYFTGTFDSDFKNHCASYKAINSTGTHSLNVSLNGDYYIGLLYVGTQWAEGTLKVSKFEYV